MAVNCLGTATSWLERKPVLLLKAALVKEYAKDSREGSWVFETDFTLRSIKEEAPGITTSGLGRLSVHSCGRRS